MKRFTYKASGLLTAVLLMASSASIPSANAQGLLLYKPPPMGTPSKRIGSGTRELKLVLTDLRVLAPEHTGLTSGPSPTLYWYSPRQGTQSINVTVLDEGRNEIVLDKTISFDGGGYQSISLKTYGIALTAGAEYRWSVVAADERDYYAARATGSLMYQKPKSQLTSVEDYAKNGYWYDSLAILMSDRSDKAKQQLQTLLEQGGIQLPSDFGQ